VRKVKHSAWLITPLGMAEKVWQEQVEKNWSTDISGGMPSKQRPKRAPEKMN
jgi:hypothetical protein